MFAVKDYFTKWTKVYQSSNLRDFKVVHKLVAFFLPKRIPTQLPSDKG